MMPLKESRESRERKQLLIAEAGLHRALFRAECIKLRDRVTWLDETRGRFRGVGSWVGLGSTALGLLTAWRARKAAKAARWIPAALALWKWIQQMRKRRSG